MNTEYYNLDKPVEQVIKHIYVKFSINDITITPYRSANIYVNLYNYKNECTYCNVFLMEGYAYDQWGDSDDYLIEWTKQHLS